MHTELYHNQCIIKTCTHVPEFKDRLFTRGELYLDEQDDYVLSGMTTERERAIFFEAVDAIQLKLEEYGILVVPTTELYTDNNNIMVLYTAIEQLTPEALIKRLSTHNDFRKNLMYMIDADDTLTEHYITKVIEQMQEFFPNAVRLEHLYDNRYILTSSEKYVEDLKLILTHTQPSIPNTVKLARYIVRVTQHRERALNAYNKIKRMVEIALPNVTDWDEDLRAVDPTIIGLYPNTNPTVGLLDEDVDWIHNHKLNSPHHIEHYHALNLTLDTKALSLVAAEYVDVDKEQVLKLCDKLNLDEFTIAQLLKFKTIGES